MNGLGKGAYRTSEWTVSAPTTEMGLALVTVDCGPFNMALSSRGIRPSSSHQRADTSPSQQEDYISPWIKLTHKGTDTRNKKNYDPAK